MCHPERANLAVEWADSDVGVRPPPAIHVDPEALYPFVAMADIDAETGLQSRFELVKGRELKTSKTRFLAGDILFAKITPCVENGKVAMVPGVNSSVGFATTEVFRVGPSRELDAKFLLYFLRGPTVRRAAVASMTGSTGRQRVPRAFLESLQIPVPPLDAQRRIIAELESILPRLQDVPREMSRLTHLEKRIQIAVVGEVLSRFRDEQDWVPLSKWIERIQSGWSPACLPRPAGYEEWGVLKVSAVSSGVFKPTENKALPPSLKARPELAVRAVDFLSHRANTRELIGTSCFVVDKPPPNLMLSDKLFRFIFRPEMGVDPVFLKQVMDRPEIRSQIQARATGTSSSMLNISQRSLLQVRVPPVRSEDQHAAGKILRSTEMSLARIRGARDQVRLLAGAAKESVLDRAYDRNLR